MIYINKINRYRKNLKNKTRLDNPKLSRGTIDRLDRNNIDIFNILGVEHNNMDIVNILDIFDFNSTDLLNILQCIKLI